MKMSDEQSEYFARHREDATSETSIDEWFRHYDLVLDSVC
jgi:hypothetical protein